MPFKKIISDGFYAALAAGIPDQITQDAYLELDQPPSHVIAVAKLLEQWLKRYVIAGMMVLVLLSRPMKTTVILTVSIELPALTRFLINVG